MNTNFLDSHSVRTSAETRLLTTPLREPVDQTAKELIYELQVHQVELEMQNEELRRNHLYMEESRDRYIELYDGAQVGYLLLTEDGLIAELNLTAAKLLGLQREKLLSSRFASLVMPKNDDQWYLFFAKIMKQKQQLNIELMLKSSNDTQFPVLLNCLPVKSMLRVTLTDISQLKQNSEALIEAETLTMLIAERKQIELRLSEADAFNLSILNSLTAHIAVLNDKGIIIATNDAWRQFAQDNSVPEASQSMIGIDYLKACGQAINNPYGEEANEAQSGITAVIKGELNVFNLVYPCHSPDKQRWFQMNVSPLQGTSKGVVVSHENITERHEIQILLEYKEQMLSESQRITHIGSWSVDLETEYLSFSDEAYQIFGLSQEALEHTWEGFVKIIHPDDRALMKKWIKNCRAGKVSREQDFRVVLPGGAIRLIQASGELQYDELNKPFRMAGTGQDITERNDRNQRDKEHLDQLAHITRLGLMGDMASGIVHEVNQPLTAITNYTQASLNYLKTESFDREKLADIIQKIQQQALRTSEIIQNMREFTKSHVMQPLKTDVNALIKAVNLLCAAVIKENDIHLTLELANNLPMINVDHIQIEQVIINLIRNSADALESIAKITPRQITVKTQLTPDNALQISVKDNGPGLSEEQQQKIMAPFYTTKPNGMGIGLSISLSIIEAHKGTLHFESLPGNGTVFYITLPI